MSEVSATAVVAQMARTEHLYESRQRVLATYDNFLGRLLVTKPACASGHLAVLRFTDEGWCTLVKKRLTQNDVQWSVHYRIHDQFRDTQAYDLSKRILSIPCHSQMKPHHASKIARMILSA
jgi:dTDP-4-amino-4,6-dideoxygalactose transaminase